MKYKGYIGSTDVDIEGGILFGKVLHIRDLVNYEAETPAGLAEAFRDAVDEYLADCAEEGVEPDLPFKGLFNVRVDPRLHRELAVAAKACGISMNEYVEKALSCHREISANGHRATVLSQPVLLQAFMDHAGTTATKYFRHLPSNEPQSTDYSKVLKYARH